MDADENPYQAQAAEWDRFYRTVVLPQQHTLETQERDILSDDLAWSEYVAKLQDLDIDIPLTDREEYSEDFVPESECGHDEDVDRIASRPRRLSETRSRAGSESESSAAASEQEEVVADEAPSELSISNQMHNKYALSPETSAYANELVGIFNDEDFGNVIEHGSLRETGLRDFCKSSMEDLAVLPDPFPKKLFE